MSEEKKLWVPGQKMPDRVKQLSLMMFIEVFKARFARPEVFKEWSYEVFYRQCIEMAETIYKIENEEKR